MRQTADYIEKNHPAVFKVLATNEEITFSEYFQYLQWCVDNNKTHADDVIGRIRSDQ